MFHCLLLASMLALAGCATGSSTAGGHGRITTPKIVGLDAPRAPWVDEIELRLRQGGFSVVRGVGRPYREDAPGGTGATGFHESMTRYVLVLDGRASLEPSSRCFGRVFRFDYLNARLVDTRTDDMLFSLWDSGYSEDCSPFRGRLFSELLDGIQDAWPAR